ncbi:hypothetical protein M1248_31435 [Mycobacterium sp. 29Ha]|nr:hypothetical protein [Mycobacterium sp. 29Ha]MDV3136490.1 hypothetical protein [Mycobacterium sp. 29Ha]
MPATLTSPRGERHRRHTVHADEVLPRGAATILKIDIDHGLTQNVADQWCSADVRIRTCPPPLVDLVHVSGGVTEPAATLPDG